MTDCTDTPCVAYLLHGVVYTVLLLSTATKYWLTDCTDTPCVAYLLHGVVYTVRSCSVSTATTDWLHWHSVCCISTARRGLYCTPAQYCHYWLTALTLRVLHISVLHGVVYTVLLLSTATTDWLHSDWHSASCQLSVSVATARGLHCTPSYSSQYCHYWLTDWLHWHPLVLSVIVATARGLLPLHAYSVLSRNPHLGAHCCLRVHRRCQLYFQSL